MKKTRCSGIMEGEINTNGGLGNNDGGVQLEVEDHSFKPIWKYDAG